LTPRNIGLYTSALTETTNSRLHRCMSPQERCALVLSPSICWIALVDHLHGK
jgi:hypothetical protein